MFGVSFGEVLLVMLVGFLVLKPEDIRSIFHHFSLWLDKFNKETESIKKAVREIGYSETINEIKTVYDTDNDNIPDLKDEK